MIVTELIDDHPGLVKTFSDAGMMIIQDDTGYMYGEAIDPIDAHRSYTESDIKIDGDQADEQDYQDALARFGVDV